MIIFQAIQAQANPQKAKQLARFFKTGKGEYGESDVFLGLTVPQQRKIVRQYQRLEMADITKLLHSKIHEYRLIALLILVEQFNRADLTKQKQIFTFYLKNTRYINNWDLVDLTAPKIVGQYLLEHPEQKPMLIKLAKSWLLWERRIGIMATFAFIKNKQLRWTLKLSKILLCDQHDLIHKAVGWMLREVGKIDQKVEETFLDQYAKTMPRTMLRYAIEKFPEKKRRFYLKLK